LDREQIDRRPINLLGRAESEASMNTSLKGARAERKARAILEAAGFTVTRAAASKGPADLIAWDGVSIRFISVKSGTTYASALEREALQLMRRPTCSTIEIWRFRDRKAPLIEVLS
jgi:Holliday junction resolvase-like predicted endonuclease